LILQVLTIFQKINPISYDGLHFKPYVGKQLLDITYGNSSTVMNASKAAALLR
jgi:hypothetical protein